MLVTNPRLSGKIDKNRPSRNCLGNHWPCARSRTQYLNNPGYRIKYLVQQKSSIPLLNRILNPMVPAIKTCLTQQICEGSNQSQAKQPLLSSYTPLSLTL